MYSSTLPWDARLLISDDIQRYIQRIQGEYGRLAIWHLFLASVSVRFKSLGAWVSYSLPALIRGLSQVERPFSFFRI